MKNPDSDRLHPNHWDDHFRQRFADFESEPPANALARILADLPTPAPAFSGRRTWLLGGLCLFLLLVGSWFVSQRLWPASARLMANKPQAQQKSETVAGKKPAISGTLSARSATPAIGTVSNEPWPDQAVDPTINVDPPITKTDNQSVAPYESRRVPGPASNSFDRTPIPAASSSENGREATLLTAKAAEKTAIDNRQSSTARVAQPKAIDDRLPVPLEIPTVVKNEPEPSETTVTAQAVQQSIRKKQASDSQIVSVSKPATQPVAPAFGDNSTVDKTAANTPPVADEKLPLEPQPVATFQHISLASLAAQPMQPTRLTLPLPDIELSALPKSAPAMPSVSRQRPVLFVGVMPLYTYQRIDPIQTDEVWIKDVKTQSTFSSQRAGLRFQAGVEWPLSRRISLRTSLIYSQLNQRVSYSMPTDRPDSVRVERVDEKTVRLIPYYSDKQITQQSNWHYVGAGTDFVFHLGQLGAWRHYASVGATAGAYVGSKAAQMAKPWSGFIQGAYGIERQLTPSLWLRIAPTVQYGLTTLSDADGLFMVRPYTYGLTIGLRK